MKTVAGKRTCPECGSNDIIEDYATGEWACKHCGLVLEEIGITAKPEWQAYTQDEMTSRSRAGPPGRFSTHDKGLQTTIGSSRGSSGRRAPDSKRIDMSRLRRLQNQSQSQRERNLAKAMIELDRLASRLFIPAATKEEAAIIYRKALANNLIRGRAIKEMVAASLYAACRMFETPRDLKEFEAVLDSGTHRKDVARCYRLLLSELDMKMPIHDPIKCVSKIASKAAITPAVQQHAVNIINESKKSKEAAGKDPMGFAAAALYLASLLDGEKHTQRELSDASNVADVTVRNRFKAIAAELFPDKFSWPKGDLEEKPPVQTGR